MNKNTAMTLTLAVMLAMALSAVIVIADPNAPTTLSQVSSTKRDLSTVAPKSIGAQGGNVTEVNINALTITRSWQGYYGNVTGQIALQNALNETFYNWSLTAVRGEVYATRVNSVTWTSVGCANAANRTLEETYLGQALTDGDSVTNTYNSTTHPALNVSTVQISANTCFSTYGYVNNNSQASDFPMVLLQSGANIVYTTILDDNTVGFDGKAHDFELLVGENEKDGNLGATPYYFWVELN